MMLAREKMFVLNLTYGTAASRRVPSGYLLRLVNRKPPLHIPDVLQLLQERINSRVAPKISKSISDRESVHTERQPVHSRWTILAGPAERDCTCHRSVDGSRKA